MKRKRSERVVKNLIRKAIKTDNFSKSFLKCQRLGMASIRAKPRISRIASSGLIDAPSTTDNIAGCKHPYLYVRMYRVFSFT